MGNCAWFGVHALACLRPSDTLKGDSKTSLTSQHENCCLIVPMVDNGFAKWPLSSRQTDDRQASAPIYPLGTLAAQ